MSAPTGAPIPGHSVEDFRREIVRLLDCCLRHPQPIDAEKIVEVPAWEPSIPDERTGYAVFRMQDGAWGTLDEWQDYSGHG